MAGDAPHVNLSSPPSPAAPGRSFHEALEAFGELRGRSLQTFLICLFVWTFVNMEQSLFGYAMPEMSKEFGIGIQAIGLIISLGFVFAIFGAIAAGVLTDRYGRRAALVGCFSLSSLFYALQAVAPGVGVLAAGRSLRAGTSAGLSPITNAFVAEASPPRIRALMVGFLQIGFPLGWFLASIAVVPMLTHFGWRAIFLCGLAGPPIGWWIYRTLPESLRFRAVEAQAANRRPWRAQLGELFAPDQRRRTILSIAAFMTKGGAYAGLAFYLPTFLHEVRGYDSATAARIIGYSYAIGTIGYVAACGVGEFILSRKTTIILWCWAGAVALVAFIWLPTTPVQDVIACGVMAIFSFGTAAILTIFILEQYPTRIRATAASCASASISLGFALFPTLVAMAVARIGWQPALTLCITPLLVLTGVAVLAMRSTAPGEEMADI